MNRLSIERRAQILGMMVEGVSIRAISRMTGASKNTIVKLLADAGKKFANYQNEKLRNLSCKRIQCDEVWSFCGMKDKNVPDELKGQFGFGSVWTWTAIDADTKLIPCWLVGERSAEYAHKFINDLASRLAHRVQLTTDGHRPYLEAIEGAFGAEVDYAMLVKLYSNPSTGNEARYSPGDCCGTHKMKIKGNPDKAHVSTSFAERQNLTMRMQMRRFTRLTNAFSKKVENHNHAISIYFMYYNFCRVHQTLRVTPAMQAGVADHVWSVEEIAGLLN